MCEARCVPEPLLFCAGRARSKLTAGEQRAAAHSLRHPLQEHISYGAAARGVCSILNVLCAIAPPRPALCVSDPPPPLPHAAACWLSRTGGLFSVYATSGRRRHLPNSWRRRAAWEPPTTHLPQASATLTGVPCPCVQTPCRVVAEGRGVALAPGLVSPPVPGCPSAGPVLPPPLGAHLTHPGCKA